MSTEIYTKEYTISQILSESWKKFKENFKTIALITLIVYVPINIILAFTSFDAFPADKDSESYMRIIQFLVIFIGMLASMAIAYVVKSNIDGQVISLKEALKKSFYKWQAAIGTNLLLIIFLIGLTLLLIIPGIIYSIYWMFTLYAVALKDKSGRKALDYSKSIVKGRWWKVAGYFLVFGVIGMCAGITATIFLSIFPSNFIFDLVTDLLIDILYSFFTVVVVIFFINFDATKKEEVKSY